MTRTNLAEWSYWLGCASAASALIFRALFILGFATPTGVSIVETTGLRPSSLLEFSLLCFVFSVATRR